MWSGWRAAAPAGKLQNPDLDRQPQLLEGLRLELEILCPGLWSA